ncbi:MAG: histidine kinase [Treponema sp.]
MFFIAECFLVTLFCALFLVSVSAGVPALNYAVLCFSAAVWLKISGTYAGLFSRIVCTAFVLWSVLADPNIVFFIPVLITAGFPSAAVYSQSEKRQYTSDGPQLREKTGGIRCIGAKLLLSTLVCLRFQPVFCVFTLLIFFYSAVKTFSYDIQETVLTMKDTLTETRIESERQNRLLCSDSLKNAEAAVLTERNRISRSLHNSIGHTLSSAILQVNALKYLSTQSDVRKLLDILQGSLEKGMTEIRECLHNLHNDSFDLQTALETVITETARLKIRLTCKTGNIPYMLKHDIISIVKECISNTIKHSGASEMTITVLEQPAFYSLSVWDNGCGVPASAAPAEGIGLTILREIAEKNKGTVNFYSEKGFKIYIIFPKEMPEK